jgi:beta-1,4-N-acetylglucosaminyltransferase
MKRKTFHNIDTRLFNKVLLASKHRSKIIYVESICRVSTLSMSAKILTYFADEILVQWPELAVKFPKSKYIARFT